MTLSSSQDFVVQGPQYFLPKDSVHSVYPPQGHADEARILPHVVLTDRLQPWERPASEINPHVPWLALLVFSPEELRLSADQLAGFPQPVTQDNTSFSIRMPISNLA